MVLVEVFALAGGARAAVGDVDARAFIQLRQRQAAAGVARARDHRAERRAIDVDRRGITRALVALHPRFEAEAKATALVQVAHGFVIGLDDAGEAAEFGRHVGQRCAFIGAQRADRAAAKLEHAANPGA